jgi:formate dehydrogenase subunit gamma
VIRILKNLTLIGLASVSLLISAQQAPAQNPAQPVVVQPGAPAVAAKVDTAGPGPASMNIFDVQKAAKEQQERQVQQPGNNAPLWREVNSGTSFYTSIPGKQNGVLIQKEGQAWRLLRNGPMTQYGGWGLVGVLLAISAFYLYRGQIKLREKRTGVMIERFTFMERAVHWTNAAAFVTLALTGIVMLFGKHVVLPIFGHTLFSWVAMLSKTTHNFIGPVFSATTVAIFLIFVKENFPKAYDLKWILGGGGLLNDKHIPSGKFNAGEKVVFWGGVVVLGIIVTVTGYQLNFMAPTFDTVPAEMHQNWLWHVSAALGFIVIISGHIYIGTLGMEGALDAMKTGQVDEAWAKEHHEHWYDDVKSGKVPRTRTVGIQSALNQTAPIK